jgi:ABC-2 type transport system permease protein
MTAIRAIIAKEMADILRNRMLVLSSLVPSVIFLVIPFTIAGARMNPRAGRVSVGQMSDLIVRMSPELEGLSQNVLGQIFVFRMFVVFLLIIPVITALAIASYSIIGEKQTRSLEPLLATPITSVQLMLAKSLSAALPAIVLTWVVFGLYAAGISFFALPQVLPNVLTPITFTMVGLICPLVAILGLSMGVIVSSRANDPRTAQQIGGLAILPIVALFTGQMQGFFYLQLPVVLAAAVVLAVIDIIVLGLGVALFDRETILVRWK